MGSADIPPSRIEAFIGYDRNLPVHKVAGTIARYRNGFDRILTTVQDVRNHQDDYELDVHGFQFISTELSEVSRLCTHVDHCRSAVYAQTQDLLKSITGASRVHCYSHLVRQKPLSAIQSICDDKNVPDTQLTKLAVPSPAVHIDHSAKGSWEVLVDNLGEVEAEFIRSSGRRWGIVNLWRPLKTVQRDPLVLCDVRTVNEHDLVPQRIYLPKSTNSTFKDVSRGASFESVGVRPNPKHEWYYCSEMTPDEALLIKIHDSAAGEIDHKRGRGSVAGGAPHTSLQIPGTDELDARESIELRCLVFW